jgi:hypothetical protein
MDQGNLLGPASPSLPSYTPVEQLCVPGNGIDIQGFYSVRTGGGAEQLFYYDEIRFNDDLTRGLMPNEITLPRTQLRAIGVVGDRYGLPTGPNQVTAYVIVGIKAGVLGNQALRFADVPRCSISKVFYRGNAALTVLRLPLDAAFEAMRARSAELGIVAMTIATADLPLVDAPLPLWLPGFPPRAMLQQRSASLRLPPADPRPE